MKLALLSSRDAPIRILALATATVFSCLIAFQAYTFWGSLHTTGAPTTVRTTAPQKSNQNSPDIGRLAATHLFGDVENLVPQYSEAKEDKSLNLTLRGIVADSADNASLAIIQSGPNNEETFALGDNVFNKGKLDFVAADHVILARSNGQLTRLQLPEQETTGLTSEEYQPPSLPEPEYMEPEITEPVTSSEPETVDPAPEQAQDNPPDPETTPEPAAAEPAIAAEPAPEPAIENQDQAPEPAP
jgi:type II secretory pathway component PulC